MCFSASVSFGAGALLIGIGALSIQKTNHRSQLLFAGIPFIFGVQQLSEGVLWLTLPSYGHETMQNMAMYLYLFFAQVVWPIWVPIAVLFLELAKKRRGIQLIFVIAGLLVGLYLLFCLLNYNVEAKMEGDHIRYLQDYPASLRNIGIGLYGLATIAPGLFTHIRRMWLLAISILLSYILTVIYYEHYILSVWCFFSSIISLSIFGIMVQISREEPTKK